MSQQYPAYPFRKTAIALVLPLLLAACGGGGSDSPAPVTPTPAPPTAPAVTLSAAATVSQMLPGATTTLSATASDNSAITWQLAAGAPGKLSATTGGSVVYTAPAAGIAVPTEINVTASAAGISKSVQLVVNPDPGSAGLSLIAGSLGSHTVVDGDVNTARFGYITELRSAADGSLLVVDNTYTAIRKVSLNGTVTTLTEDRARTENTLGRFLGVVAAADGGAWVVQEQSSSAVLRRIRPDGSKVTVGAPLPELASTVALIAGGADELFALVAGREDSAIYRVTTTGTVTLVAGGPAAATPVDGQGAAARFSTPVDMTRTANGELRVIDGLSVRRITADGQVTTMPLVDSASGTTPEVSWLHSITARPDGTLALLAHTPKRYTVYSVAADGKLTTLASGARAPENDGGAPRQTDFTRIRTAPNGDLLLANRGEIQRWQNGAFTRIAGLEDDSAKDVDGTGAAARFVDPMFVASDQRGTIYVADHPTGYGSALGIYDDHGLYLRRIDATGKVTTMLTNDDFDRPRGLLADRAGNLYVLEQPPKAGRIETRGGAVYRITPNGTLTLIAGSKGATDGTLVDGKGTQARFATPTFAGMAPDGTLYVYDWNNVIRKVTLDGTVTTVATLPADVGLAPDGKRYAYDDGAIYRIEADGSRTVVAGQKGKDGPILGALPGAVGPAAALTPTGLHTFALITNGALVKLVVPH